MRRVTGYPVSEVLWAVLSSQVGGQPGSLHGLPPRQPGPAMQGPVPELLDAACQPSSFLRFAQAGVGCNQLSGIGLVPRSLSHPVPALPLLRRGH